MISVAVALYRRQELERLELRAELYEKLGTPEDLERAEEVVLGLVRRSPDQWSYYVSLLDLLDKRNGVLPVFLASPPRLLSES